MRGIVLAGGSGTRLYPATKAMSKQLLPIGDKPMIYYPLSVLMLAGIREIMVISTPLDTPRYEHLLGDGSDLGMEFTFAAQAEPRGIAEALLIGADFIGDDSVALILGDNIFHGHGFGELLRRSVKAVDGCTLFGYPVRDPERFGVAVTDQRGNLVDIEEKPSRPRSNKAITGLYLYSPDVVDKARELKPSARNELEITDINRAYLREGRARLVDIDRGYAWLDTGTPAAMADASQYVLTLEDRQGLRIACLEEIAVRMGFIDVDRCRRLGERMGGSSYGAYLRELAEDLGSTSSSTMATALAQPAPAPAMAMGKQASVKVSPTS
ncbi:glucose-1-phosphate thymidylyltransferase [Enemella evansiae]|nr:glucose-1-phosphate thymidylyltransferase RfbA [Enemella evansiae]OYO15511.1 glucose-1-phosphate thymidylyltransferase [Enemella evansiae]